jgi:tight adherence protein B
MIPFFVFLFCLFVTYATFLLVTRKTAAQREQMKRRLADALIYADDAEDPRIQLARVEMMSEIPVVNRLLLDIPVAVNLKQWLDQADLHLTVMRLLMFSALAAALAALAAMMVTILLPLIAVTALAAACVPFLYVLWKRKQRLEKFLISLPDALDLMSRALSAGHAFSETLNMISQEMADPIAMEFRRTYEEHNLGLSSKLALENLAQRMPLLDLRMCITAIQIQRETGGNLAEILEKVAHTIRERFRILEDLKTLTTQSRISAWILCAIPVVVAVATTILNPDYMSVMWSDPRGHKLIALASGMQISGMLLVRKILQIKI